MNLNDINALCIVLLSVIIVFISITMDFKDNKIKKCNTNVNKKDMPLTCPECSYYRGCDDCTEYGCDSILKRLYCKK